MCISKKASNTRKEIEEFKKCLPQRDFPDTENPFMELISNNSYQSPKETPPVSLGHPPSLFRRPTKETNTKETLQNKQQQQEVARPAALVAASFEKKRGQEPRGER